MKTFTIAGEKINGISSSDSNTYARLIAIYFYFNGFDLKIRLQRQQNAFDFFPLVRLSHTYFIDSKLWYYIRLIRVSNIYI